MCLGNQAIRPLSAKVIYYPVASFLTVLAASMSISCRSVPARMAESDGRDTQTSPETCDFSDESALASLAAIVAGAWQQKLPPQTVVPKGFSAPMPPVYVAFRSKGMLVASSWQEGMSLTNAILAAAEQAKSSLSSREAAEPDTVELSLTHSYRNVNLGDPRELKDFFADAHRGIRGLELTYEGLTERCAPTQAITMNRSNKRLLELFKEGRHLSDRTVETRVKCRVFEAHQILVRLRDPPRAVLMERGGAFVPVSAVTRENVAETAALAAEWMANNVHEDGRFTYKYWPSRGRESTSNNMIRQWMSTALLANLAVRNRDARLGELAGRNIGYNLDHFYREEGEFGLIEYDNEVKLGGLALAALSIAEREDREKWSAQEAALLRTIDHLWNPDGSFRTFYRPDTRNDNQNFYPGETLLLWAVLYDGKDSRLLERFMKSFEYYRNRHLEVDRNPAFIPWHTQAYYAAWRKTRDERLSDFIFTMNDWLLDIQQWEGQVPYRDMLGQFYDPIRPFGPPHASSTGAYVEGLIDAFCVARDSGDAKREEAYRIAIIRGLRSIMQLQFVDDIDMYYVSEARRGFVRGGIRSNVYDNAIRCDNVAHCLTALLKILDTFKDEDYRHDKP